LTGRPLLANCRRMIRNAAFKQQQSRPSAALARADFGGT
jgi:hypothetical protein